LTSSGSAKFNNVASPNQTRADESLNYDDFLRRIDEEIAQMEDSENPLVSLEVLSKLEQNASQCASRISDLIGSLRSVLKADTEISRQAVDIFASSSFDTFHTININIVAAHSIIAACVELSRHVPVVTNVRKQIESIKARLNVLEEVIYKL